MNTDPRGLIFRLLIPQMDEEELQVFNHIQDLTRKGILAPYPAPKGMSQDRADAIAEDIVIKMASIAEQVIGQDIPETGEVQVEITPVEEPKAEPKIVLTDV